MDLVEEAETITSKIRIPETAYKNEDKAGEFIESVSRSEIRHRLNAIKKYLDQALQTLGEMSECRDFD